eukprot:scaffold25025_cov129-Isochrysis_galbana.AAC.4
MAAALNTRHTHRWPLPSTRNPSRFPRHEYALPARSRCTRRATHRGPSRSNTAAPQPQPGRRRCVVGCECRPFTCLACAPAQRIRLHGSAGGARAGCRYELARGTHEARETAYAHTSRATAPRHTPRRVLLPSPR